VRPRYIFPNIQNVFTPQLSKHGRTEIQGSLPVWFHGQLERKMHKAQSVNLPVLQGVNLAHP